ncbi:PLP-dependent transferase [Apiospora rasikravindrae]|uniref:PLP-dependent transferase n=1 Tax=Apiospora rasikravindrae TaxID=990691 RepID=A0ABR1U9Q3_9PEZI
MGSIAKEFNGTTGEPLQRADELEDLIDAVKSLIVPYVRSADQAASFKAAGQVSKGADGQPQNVLIDTHKPAELIEKLKLSLPEAEGRGKEGLLATIQDVLKYSVNTWDQGFLDKLYASTNAVGVVSELLLSVLNTNVSPRLPSLARLDHHRENHSPPTSQPLRLRRPRAGGVTCQGGSASNLTSIAIARNALYPECKTAGNGARRFVLFTSAHGHYSVEKAAVTCGMGAQAVVPVAVDPATGCMDPAALRAAVLRVHDDGDGRTPLYVNATAGTTVLGSFDDFRAISAVCREFGMWLHIDGSWGGPCIFSASQKHKLAGSELADSITVNPHKMMNVPVTCSFLLTNDLTVFHKANTLPAGYLFHGAGDDGEVYDLADLTLQCGRRADSLKLALAWIYYGAAGFEKMIDHAFTMAAHMANLIDAAPDFELASSNPPPCLQICFYYTPGGKLAESKEENTRRTREMVGLLIGRGFMVDYAPGPNGSFFRVVVNCQTLKETVEGLVKALGEVGKEVVGA